MNKLVEERSRRKGERERAIPFSSFPPITIITQNYETLIT
jgi:hypothetical protein